MASITTSASIVPLLSVSTISPSLPFATLFGMSWHWILIPWRPSPRASRAAGLVEARRDFRSAIDERRLDAEPMEDIGEFDGDITAADNDDQRGNSSR